MHPRYYDTEIGGFYPVLSITEGMFETRSNLAATLGHEVEVHFQQQIVPAGMKQETDPVKYAQNEVKALQYNVENAKRFGNTPAEVANFKREIEQKTKDYRLDEIPSGKDQK